MRRKFVQFLCGAAVCILSLGCPAAALAEQAETEVWTDAEAQDGTEAEIQADTEAQDETETEKAADVEVLESDKVLWTVENQTGITFASAKLEKTELILEEEDGTEHKISGIDKDDVEGTPVLSLYGRFTALQYLSKDSGIDVKMVEEGEEISLEKPEVMYVVDDVYVRAEADSEAEAVSVAGRGSEIEVLGELPKWYRIKLGDGEGYIAKSYVTDKKEEADQAVKAEAQARAQIAAQAEAEALAAAQAAAAQAPQGRYEVSRQAYDDCDGSGHGYYEITYSDGSVETEEY